MNTPARPATPRDSGLDGLLVLDKPLRLSSARALDRVRRILKQRKSGHAGTLDPAATGVLLIGLGRCTRLTERLMDLDKEYATTIRLDVTSTSFDAERPLLSVNVERVPTDADVETALRPLIGLVQQVPPAVSAIKVGGRAAYERERKGEQVILPPRPVRIDRIEMLSFDWPELELLVTCGRGFYVRALARDLGAALGTGGCLTQLRRTRVGPFGAMGAWSIEALESRSDPTHAVLPPEMIESLLRAWQITASSRSADSIGGPR